MNLKFEMFSFSFFLCYAVTLLAINDTFQKEDPTFMASCKVRGRKICFD